MSENDENTEHTNVYIYTQIYYTQIGPMGAQYNLPVPPHAMGNPFFTQQPPTGPSPFLNHSNNPFWNPPTNQAPGNNPNRQGQVRPGGGRGRASRGGGGNNSSRGGWNR